MKNISGLFAASLIIAALMGISASAAQVGNNGTVSGRVLQSDGTPAVGIGVGALAIPNPECAPAQYGINTGDISAFSALSAYVMTDGAGRFRLENIQPGKYYLAAGTFRLPPQAVTRCYSQAKYKGYIGQPTYFPGVAGFNMATAVTVTSGASIVPDFRLLPEPASATPGFKISGRVTGSPVMNNGGILIVQLANSGTRPSAGPCKVFATNVAPDGAFEFRNIPPCAYAAKVLANRGDTQTVVFPGVDTGGVVVMDKDIDGIVLGPGARGTGR